LASALQQTFHVLFSLQLQSTAKTTSRPSRLALGYRVKKNQGFFCKKAQPSGFGGGFGQAGKIGKIIQKLSNLKP